MFNDRRERGTTLGAIYDSAVAEPGEWPGPPLFLDQNEARRATIISGSRLPVSYTHLTLPTKRIV